ncbi:exocyst complex component, sec15 subunit [Clavulina sp. PMI_390]|nr:exocyst complex component, sec15 subunit [Clavulina sp. PMI_390]
MPPRKKLNFSQQDIDSQLQSIHLLDSSSATENLETLGPIIKNISESRQLPAYLSTINGLIDSKDEEIQKICRENYIDFVASVSTLLKVRSHTVDLRKRVEVLDTSVASAGKGLASKKKELLQNRKTAANLDSGIDTLQSCLRILDVIKRVRDMIKEGRYWSALRSIDEIQALPPNALSQTPLYTHLLSSLPSLRTQIKDAVNASKITFLLEIREASADIGKLALEAMRQRARRWRSRRDKEPNLRNLRVGSAVELVSNEKIERKPYLLPVNLLDNDKVKLDLSPLHQSIQIYTALSALPELQASYQRDRKEQASLIMASVTAPTLIGALPILTQSLLGFFVVETEVLRTTIGFRNWGQVEELWEDVLGQLVERLENGLRYERDPETIVGIKDILTPFVQSIEIYDFDTTRLQAILSSMFTKHVGFLIKEFSVVFEKAVTDDDSQPMVLTSASERDNILATCWMPAETATALVKQSLPIVLPFSNLFYTSCTEIRRFVEKFYYFTDGASHYFKNVDSALRNTLDTLLSEHLSKKLDARIPSTSSLFQAAQVITNIEHFLAALPELEQQLAKLRTTRTGGQIRLTSAASFEHSMQVAKDRINSLIRAKLDDFFDDVTEYQWTPPQPGDRQSMYLEELYHWLMTVVDSLPLEEKYKAGAFKAAVDHVASYLLNFLCGPIVPMLNENGISNILVDVDFLETEFKAVGREELGSCFNEIRQTTSLILNNTLSSYLQPAARRSTFANVNPKNLAVILEKLIKYGSSSRNPAERDAAERRKKDLEAIVRLG